MFEKLELERGLRLGLETMGLTEPTEVQAQVVPAALAGKDLQVRADTGSGKTLAYLLPLAQRLLETPGDRGAGTLGLVLVPTRELARQVLGVARRLFQQTRLQAGAITGGADFKYQRSIFRSNPELVIATPGRLREHCERGSVDLTALRCLVLDEADRMLELGLREDVLYIAGHIPAERQVLMLSATLRQRGLREIVDQLTDSIQTITIGEVRAPHGRIVHQRILADGEEHKDRLLQALLAAGGYRRALVFANRRHTAARLAGLLSQAGLRAAALHGEMSTEERRAVMSRFSGGGLDILCASDLAARGLDVEGIDLVVNYHLPGSGEDYLHRTGRTGRAGATGLAVALVSAREWNLMIAIQRYLKISFETRSLPGLKAKYSGPKQQKSSGKAAGTRKKPDGAAAGRKRSRDPQAKRRSRHRNRRAAGKPRRDGPGKGNDGFAPLTRKPRD